MKQQSFTVTVFTQGSTFPMYATYKTRPEATQFANYYRKNRAKYKVIIQEN